jgi:cyclophilin family peptidyl-prolyl cis-trans isomerase
MKSIRIVMLALALALAGACSDPVPEGSNNEVAVIETDFGKIKIRFYTDLAPQHVAQFKKLARTGFYDGLAFHRVVPEVLIQGGDPTTRGDDRTQWGKGEPGQTQVAAEFNNRPFVRGTLGAARKGNDPDSATSQFFICLRPMPQWNGQYTAFGEVIEGLNTVQIISNAPQEPGSELVRDKVLIRRVTIESPGAPARP